MAELVPKMDLKTLLNLQKGSQEKIVVCLAGEWLRIVAARTGKKAEITHLAAFQVPPGNVDEAASKVAEFIAAKGLKPAAAVSALPSQFATTRTLSFPSTDLQEIRDIVELQAVKQTPYSREEIVTDFQVVETDQVGYSKVMIVIAHLDGLNHAADLFSKTAFTIDQVAISLEGLVEWYKVATRAKEEPSGVAIVDMDAETTDLVILSQGKAAFSRSIAVGVAAFREDPEKGYTSFLTELKLSFETYKNEAAQTAAALERIILTGQAQVFSELRAKIELETAVKTEALPSILDIPSAAGISDAWKEASGSGASFTSLIGLALGQAGMNFLPPEMKIQKTLEERGKDLAMLGTLSILVVALLFGLFGEMIYRRTSYLKWVQTKLEATRAEAAEIEKAMTKVQLINSRLSNEGEFLDILRDVTQQLPDPIYLNTISYDKKDGKLNMRGTSEEMSHVFKFISALEHSAHLGSVKTKQASKRKTAAGDVTDFEVASDVKVTAPEK